MVKEITFSASVFIAFLSIPLLIYALLSGLIYLVSGWRFKYDSLICRCLLIISVISVILSLPISFYVTYKLKQDNYVACDRISWMSPNNFVKPLRFAIDIFDNPSKKMINLLRDSDAAGY